MGGQKPLFWENKKMKTLGKKVKEEMAFYINKKTNKIQYNERCKECKNNCKQSFRAEIIRCNFCLKSY